MEPLPDPLEQLWRYWLQLPRHGGNLIPSRLVFHPKDVTTLLPKITLLKRLGRFEMMIGLMGSEADQLWDQPVTGMNAFDLTTPSMHENVARFFDAITNAPSAAVLHNRSTSKQGNLLDVTSLYLPLCDREGMPDYILGCTVAAQAGWNGSLKDRLALDQDQILATKFIDIGHGAPQIQFEKPERHALTLKKVQAPNWWQRLLPSARAATARRDNH